MKKIVALFMVLALTLSLAACGNSAANDTGITTDSQESVTEAADATPTAAAIAEEAVDQVTSSGRPTEGNGKIGFSTITLGAEFFSALDAQVHDRFEAAGYEVVTVSCEANSATQVSDIENLITMQCEAIVLFAMDVDAVTDVLVKAKQAGIRVYPIACTIDNRDAYDIILGTDQYATGTSCAEMTAAWIDATFPDAEDGSIEVAVIGNTQSQEANDRTNGMLTITDLTKKAKVVEMFDLSGATDANIKSQEYAEMMVSKYPNLKAIMCYGVDGELGTNEVYMRQSGLNKSEFGIFGVDTSQVAYGLIKQSANDEALIRGTVNLGPDLGLSVYNLVTGAYNDKADENGYVSEPCTNVTIDNVDDFIQ